MNRKELKSLQTRLMEEQKSKPKQLTSIQVSKAVIEKKADKIFQKMAETIEIKEIRQTPYIPITGAPSFYRF